MSGTTLHPLPRKRAVALEQIRTVGLFTRPGAYLVAGALFVLGVMVVNAALRAHGRALLHQGGGFAAFDFDPRESVLFSGVAFLYPFFVWAGEDPSHRDYHWMMPVDRRAHALWKVLAGWIWVVAAMTVTLLAIVTIGAISSSITRQAQPEQNFAWWGWLVPFTSITIAYCLASAAVVGTRQPIVRVAAVVAAYTAATGGLLWLGYHEAARDVLQLYAGRYGFVAATFGRIYVVETPNLQRWLISTVVWGAVAGTLLFWMSSRGAEGRSSLWSRRRLRRT